MPSSISVISTIARTSLGFKVQPSFKTGEHLETDKFWSEEEGRYLAKNQMSWYLRKVGQQFIMRQMRSGHILSPKLSLELWEPWGDEDKLTAPGSVALAPAKSNL